MIPDVIYLQWFDDDGEPDGEVTWCQDRIRETDIEYRRLTLASTVTAAPVEIAATNVDAGAAAGEPNR